MKKDQLQLTVSKSENQTYDLTFKRGAQVHKINCTQAELRMVREVISKFI